MVVLFVSYRQFHIKGIDLRKTSYIRTDIERYSIGSSSQPSSADLRTGTRTVTGMTHRRKSQPSSADLRTGSRTVTGMTHRRKPSKRTGHSKIARLQTQWIRSPISSAFPTTTSPAEHNRKASSRQRHKRHAANRPSRNPSTTIGNN